MLLGAGAVVTYGFYRLAQGLRERNELSREKVWSRIHLIPVLQAEEDRDQVRRWHADQTREKELLGENTRVYHSDRYVISRRGGSWGWVLMRGVALCVLRLRLSRRRRRSKKGKEGNGGRKCTYTPKRLVLFEMAGGRCDVCVGGADGVVMFGMGPHVADGSGLVLEGRVSEDHVSARRAPSSYYGRRSFPERLSGHGCPEFMADQKA